MEPASRWPICRQSGCVGKWWCAGGISFPLGMQACLCGLLRCLYLDTCLQIQALDFAQVVRFCCQMNQQRTCWNSTTRFISGDLSRLFHINNLIWTCSSATLWYIHSFQYVAWRAKHVVKTCNFMQTQLAKLMPRSHALCILHRYLAKVAWCLPMTQLDTPCTWWVSLHCCEHVCRFCTVLEFTYQVWSQKRALSKAVWAILQIYTCVLDCCIQLAQASFGQLSNLALCEYSVWRTLIISCCLMGDKGAIRH